jgi:DNA-binding phage protein
MQWRKQGNSNMAQQKNGKDKMTFGYQHYVFRRDEQDPIIDKIKTIFADHGETVGHVASHAGVAPATLANWFNGKTRRPQFATTAAVVRSMGYDFVLAPVVPGADNDAHSVGTIVKRFPSVRDRA